MHRGSSVITDQRYYVVNRTEKTQEQTHIAVEDCDDMLRSAPIPGNHLRFNGRRPHLHGDRENHYVEERIALDPRVASETSQSAVLHGRALPKLAAYPGRQFDYAGQNRRGNDSQGDAGYNRIVTDSHKNQIGLSYHPLGSRDAMVRADQQGVFVADYRRDSIKQEQVGQKFGETSTRSSTWPQR
ncbi:uncharacterized protein CTRU02_210796 [Colletotrichum truncatum]|uniref:Uncharacterized protein n=1 Tax=Colletotrichum truncatum TaxID=5467 RepID=A0ACC3YQ68_COLTU|nr:uncharacterized protein CTRU02_03719 [Colletotrichum truncatum]KAF6796741.1 hypothetical protein CTRU02_03719 [Colletotrichum truncatum]